jgi:hypothetical protein
MRRSRRITVRPAFVTPLAIMSAGVLLLLAVVLARCATDAIDAERLALLNARAEQILLAARDWSRLHTAELSGSDEINLPFEALVPDTASGRLTLHRVKVDAQAPLIECTLQLKQSHRGVIRQVFWPADVPPLARGARTKRAGDSRTSVPADSGSRPSAP